MGLSENNYCRNLNGEKDGSDLKSRAPLLLQNVEADSAELVNVRVVDPRDESDLNRDHCDYHDDHDIRIMIVFYNHCELFYIKTDISHV